MNYETESCIYCEASASIYIKVRNLNIRDMKNDFVNLKKISKQKRLKSQKILSFNKLLNSDNLVD